MWTQGSVSPECRPRDGVPPNEGAATSVGLYRDDSEREFTLEEHEARWDSGDGTGSCGDPFSRPPTTADSTLIPNINIRDPRESGHQDDEDSVLTVPPSPTLSDHSSVHFFPTSTLALRDNTPIRHDTSILLSPSESDRRQFLRRSRSLSAGSGSGFSSLGAFSGAESEGSAYSSVSIFGSMDPRKGLSSAPGSQGRLSGSLDLTRQVTKSDTYPVESGGTADIYQGVYRSNKVAVKIFRRMHSDTDTMKETSQALYNRARDWISLEHVNVLSFLGISLDLGRSPALISPFCSEGPIMKYLKKAPERQKRRQKMIVEITNGLRYLHSRGIIHGNLCTKKILVKANGVPVISGYDIFKILRPSPTTTALFASPIRFSPPEYFSDKSGAASFRSKAGDVYALAMVILEILSGFEPFYDLPTEHAVFKCILEGRRPTRTDLDEQVITDRVWSLLTESWAQEPSSRPEMHRVVAKVSWIMGDENMLCGVYKSHGPTRAKNDAQPTFERNNVDKISTYRVHLLTICQEGKDSTEEETISSGSDLHEFHGRDLKGRVKQDDQYPFAGGGNSNLYRGKLTRSNGRKILVAIKIIRITDDGSGQQEDMLRRMKREADLWSHLKHRNILPFIGICEDIAPNGVPALIAPYYKLGHVTKYITKNPEVNRQPLVLGAASGLEFLHRKDVVHGDIKAQNVLVDKRGRVRICDFGISKIAGRRGFTTLNVGTVPYMAPELFLVVDDVGKETTPPTTTKSSDVYSFGLLVLEILTAQPPKGRPSRPIVTAKIISALQPKREDYDESKVSGNAWSCLAKCWSVKPQVRPTMSQLLGDLENCFARVRETERELNSAQAERLLRTSASSRFRRWLRKIFKS